MKHLVLLGGGLAHAQVLRSFAAQPPAGTRITLVTPHPRRLLPGMVAGLVAGRYTLEHSIVDLGALAARAGAELRASAAVAVDASARLLTLANGDSAPYDALSIDMIERIDRDAIPGARGLALFMQPTDTFARLVADLIALAQGNSLNVVLVGGGVPAVELAIALQGRLGHRARVCLVTGGAAPLAALGEKASTRAAAALRGHGVTVIEDACSAIGAAHVQLAGGARHACDAPIVATSGDPPPWLATSGLALGEDGGIATDDCLQSRSHPGVFAVAQQGQAEALALNLRHFVAGGTLQPVRARRRALVVVDVGEGRALAAGDKGVVEGRWVGWWRDWRDRRLLRSLHAAGATAPGPATSAGGS